MSEDKPITACPECDSASIRGRHSFPPERRYACNECGVEFSSPVRRSRKPRSDPFEGTRGPGHKGVSRTLSDIGEVSDD